MYRQSSLHDRCISIRNWQSPFQSQWLMHSQSGATMGKTVCLYDACCSMIKMANSFWRKTPSCNQSPCRPRPSRVCSFQFHVLWTIRLQVSTTAHYLLHNWPAVTQPTVPIPRLVWPVSWLTPLYLENREVLQRVQPCHCVSNSKLSLRGIQRTNPSLWLEGQDIPPGIKVLCGLLNWQSTPPNTIPKEPQDTVYHASLCDVQKDLCHRWEPEEEIAHFTSAHYSTVAPLILNRRASIPQNVNLAHIRPATTHVQEILQQAADTTSFTSTFPRQTYAEKDLSRMGGAKKHFDRIKADIKRCQREHYG